MVHISPQKRGNPLSRRGKWFGFKKQRWARNGLPSDNKRGGSLLGATSPVTRLRYQLQKLEPLLKYRALGWLPNLCIYFQKEGLGGTPVGLPPKALCWLPRRVALFDRRRHPRRHSLEGSPRFVSYLSSDAAADFHLSQVMGAGVFVFNFSPSWLLRGSSVSPSDYFVTQTTRLPACPASVESERRD